MVAVVVMLAAIYVGIHFQVVGLGWIAVPFLFYFIVAARGSYNIESGFFIKAICESPNDKNQVAITFDDGPNQEFTPRALEILEKYNAKATFFCIGTNVEANADILKMVDEKGHTVGNHSYLHTPKLDMTSTKNVIADLEKCDEQIQNAIGKKPLLFRLNTMILTKARK